MSGFGAAAYRKTLIDGAMGSADPHQLVLMLFDGAIERINSAQHHLANRQIPAKCADLSKACRIVELGLKAGLDHRVEPVLCTRLSTLYDYVLMRLLQGNLRNDAEALREAGKILGELREAWAQIRPQVKNMVMPEFKAEDAAQSAVASVASTPVRPAAVARPGAAPSATMRRPIAAY